MMWACVGLTGADCGTRDRERGWRLAALSYADGRHRETVSGNRRIQRQPRDETTGSLCGIVTEPALERAVARRAGGSSTEHGPAFEELLAADLATRIGGGQRAVGTRL
jgi:hypothetical protein